MISAAIDATIGAALFLASIASIAYLRPGADGIVKPIVVAPFLETALPVSIVSGMAVGFALLVAALFPLFF